MNLWPMEARWGIEILDEDQGWAMEILEDVMETTLIAMTRLGIPIVVLFVIGYLIQRESHRHRALIGPGNLGLRAGRAGEGHGWLGGDAHRRCWERKACGVETCAACPAYNRPNVPCWQALKTSRGRLEAACTHCELFLAVPFATPQDGNTERG